MPNILIPRQHQSAPSSRMPKGYAWKVRHGVKPHTTEGGVVVPSMVTHGYYVQGSRGGYTLCAIFSISPWKGEGQAEFEDRMQKATYGICHDIDVVLDGGDARGKVNLMLENLADKASDKYDIDPALLKRHFQHQDLQERD
ncbi:MAG: hypothetical protein E3J60_04680 [Dehalococcoidia bacterium]|nr:MAG: hypothetical protein E3J60_04680 [Dehalococcoidia bacterium]